MSSSNWYSNPDAVLEQFRITSAGRGVTPVIAGYDDLVEVKRGGQGVVYSATQRSTRRRVAIKLLLDGAFASEQNRRRFEREIDVVGALRNPHIVGIYDSGVSSDGHPYFVMEFVDGAPLDQFLLDASLSNPGLDRKSTTSGDARARVRRLLDLFLPICEAVQYAHQRGVIHRDLKPGNIRVDSDGRPRVLDFGLARAFQPGGEQGDATELTLSGQFMGSLHWASPEHASGNPDAIDTRSDVYSLGVILYFVLTGRFPYSVQGSLRDVLDNILHAEPARPSEFALGIDADLETIVLKCLAKEPQRRYQSAGELADDVRRYLASEPIQARRDSTWYTLRKLLRRYRWAAAAALLVLVLITSGLIVSLSLWRKAEHQRTIADTQRQRADFSLRTAEQKTEQAQAVSYFLTDMLSSVDPTEESKDIRVADVLDDAAAKVDEEFPNQPITAGAVRTAIGRSYLMLGHFDKAEEQLTKAAELLEGGDPNSLEFLELTDLLGELRLRQSRLDEAVELLREALERSSRVNGSNDKNTLTSKHHLANALRERGDLQEAEALFREALEARRQVLGEEHRQTLRSLNALAGTLKMMSRLDEAQALFEQALETQKRTLGEESSDVITTMTELAGLLTLRERRTEAFDLAARAYELAQKVYGPEHPRTFVLMENLAVAHLGMKQPADAAALLEKVLEGSTRLYGADNPDLLTTRVNLGTALARTNRIEEAIEHFREAANRAPAVLGADHPNTIMFLDRYATILLETKHPIEAEPYFRQALEAARKRLGDEHWLTGLVSDNVGRSLLPQKRYEEAEPFLLEGYDTLVKALGDKDSRTVGAASDLVELYEAWGKPEMADKYRPPPAADEE